MKFKFKMWEVLVIIFFSFCVLAIIPYLNKWGYPFKLNQQPQSCEEIYALAEAYWQGNGRPYRPHKTIELHVKASDMGYAKSSYALAWAFIHHKELHRKRYHLEPKEYFLLAAEQGMDTAYKDVIMTVSKNKDPIEHCMWAFVLIEKNIYSTPYISRLKDDGLTDEQCEEAKNLADKYLAKHP